MTSTRPHTSCDTSRTGAKKLVVRFAVFAGVLVAGSGASLADITNAATATGTYNGNPIPPSNIATAAVPVDVGVPNLVVTKTAAPDTNVPAGTVVTYTYTILNAGAQTLSNISLADVHNGSGPAPVPLGEFVSSDLGTLNDSINGTLNDGIWLSLAPNDTVTMTATYTVTQQDVDTRQ